MEEDTDQSGHREFRKENRELVGTTCKLDLSNLEEQPQLPEFCQVLQTSTWEHQDENGTRWVIFEFGAKLRGSRHSDLRRAIWCV